MQASPARTLQFVQLSPPEPDAAMALPPPTVPSQRGSADVLEVELRRGDSQVTVRCPATQVAQWLRELTGAVFGAEERTP